MSTIYLAHPIDEASDVMADIEAFRQWVKVYADVNFHLVYTPQTAFFIHGSTPKTDAVWRINMAALDNSDLLLAYMPDNAKSWGVPAEVEHARNAGTPVVLVTRFPTWSMFMPGDVHHVVTGAAPDDLEFTELVKDTLHNLGF